MNPSPDGSKLSKIPFIFVCYAFSKILREFGFAFAYLQLITLYFDVLGLDKRSILEREVDRFNKLGLRDQFVTGENKGCPVSESYGSRAAILFRINFSSSNFFALDMRVATSLWLSAKVEGLLHDSSGLKECSSSSVVFWKSSRLDLRADASQYKASNRDRDESMSETSAIRRLRELSFGENVHSSSCLTIQEALATCSFEALIREELIRESSVVVEGDRFSSCDFLLMLGLKLRDLFNSSSSAFYALYLD